LTGYRGEFNDGRTAARHLVMVTLDDKGLGIVSDPDNPARIERLWSYSDLRLIDPPRKDTPLRLTNSNEADARLRLHDGGFLDGLQQRAPHLFLRGLARPRVRRNAIIVLLSFFLVVLFLWQGVPRLSGPLARLVPLEWEQKIGAIVRDRLLAGAQRCEAGAGTAALDELTRRLTLAMAAPPSLTVMVADRGMVNAFAMPAGNIVIFRGLLKSTESPEEVAAVLAHEIGHVYHRHPLQLAMRGLGIGMVTDLLTGDGSALVELAGELGGLLLLLSYNRDMERQADEFGRDLLRRADLPTGAMTRFFARLHKKMPSTNGDNILGYLNSHPPLEERMAAGGEEHAGPPALDDEAWRALKTICD
jgi:beta-barrel assembly-enhancing protease